MHQYSEQSINGFFIDGAGVAHPPDSKLDSLTPLLPTTEVKVVDLILYVNGIKTDYERHFGDMQALANSGAAVIGLHDSTEGGCVDALRFFQSRYTLKETPVISTLRSCIGSALSNGQPLHLAGHSRGAQNIALALITEITACANQHGSTATRERTALLKVETFGGAAPFYPDGPQYLHMDNIFDPVSSIYGLLRKRGLSRTSTSPGANSVHISLRAANLNFMDHKTASSDPGLGIIDRLVHNPRSIYFSRRIPFTAAIERGNVQLS